jgi:predicted RNA binding protein YcfA (HicA-like mRNA interferase family)
MRYRLPKQPRWTAREAEKQLLKAGFELIRTKGSHRIYLKDKNRIVLPFHGDKILHPKIIKQVIKLLD